MKKNEAHMHHQCKVLLRAKYFLKEDLIQNNSSVRSKLWLVNTFNESLFHTGHEDIWDYAKNMFKPSENADNLFWYPQ